MQRLALALVLALAAVGAARADDTPANLYTLQVWAAPGGQGIARTIGPMTAETCQRNLELLKGSHYDVPPNMRLHTVQCADQGNLQWWFAAYNCIASDKVPVHKHPEYSLWVYSCFRS